MRPFFLFSLAAIGAAFLLAGLGSLFFTQEAASVGLSNCFAGLASFSAIGLR